jgi:hypothetical protein
MRLKAEIGHDVEGRGDIEPQHVNLAGSRHHVNARGDPDADEMGDPKLSSR